MKNLKEKISELWENDCLTVVVEPRDLIGLGWDFDEDENENVFCKENIVNVYVHSNGATSYDVQPIREYISNVNNSNSQETGDNEATLTDLFLLEKQGRIIKIM